MKTLEEINGQKVWAVDETEECKGCTFNCNEECTKSHDGECVGALRPDKRNVIFQPYEEEKEKTFTLSQINEVIDEVESEHPYKVRGDRDTYSQYNEAWGDALSVLKSKLEQL